jgi:hypothetical protein
MKKETLSATELVNPSARIQTVPPWHLPAAGRIRAVGTVCSSLAVKGFAGSSPIASSKIFWSVGHVSFRSSTLRFDPSVIPDLQGLKGVTRSPASVVHVCESATVAAGPRSPGR